MQSEHKDNFPKMTWKIPVSVSVYSIQYSVWLLLHYECQKYIICNQTMTIHSCSIANSWITELFGYTLFTLCDKICQ
jgi:hypothetical protein